MNIDGEGLKYHTYSDIGRYTVFPDQKVKRMFPHKYNGRIYEEEIYRTDSFGV